MMTLEEQVRGKKLKLHDMCLRDGMHSMRHQITLDQMVDIASGLDDAGVPLIQVTHGDGPSFVRVKMAVATSHVVP